MKQWDGCEDAIIGEGQRCGSEPVLVYDYDKLVKIFEKQGMRQDEAIEWVDFNILGAYIGEDTPIILFKQLSFDLENV